MDGGAIIPGRGGGQLEAIDFATPKTIDEAVEIMASNGDRARMLAGGTDLIVQLRAGRRSLDVVVDSKGIPELNELSYDAQNGLTIGAAVPCYKLYEDPAISKAYPGLIDAATLIGGIQIQGRASIGGNLCNAGPAGDSIPALIVHSATCNIAGPNGLRSIAVEDFCTAPGRNVLGPDEMLVSLTVPAPPSDSGTHYLRFIPRNEMDIAVVGGGFISFETPNRTTAETLTPYSEALEKYGGLVQGKDYWVERLPEDHIIFHAFFDLRGGMPNNSHTAEGKSGLLLWNYAIGHFIKGRMVGLATNTWQWNSPGGLRLAVNVVI